MFIKLLKLAFTLCALTGLFSIYKKSKVEKYVTPFDEGFPI